MPLLVSRAARTVLLTAIAVLVVGSGPASTASNSTIQVEQKPTLTEQQELAKAPYEVRLRKLHLVRPDLIPFPIFFEVYC